MFLVACNFTEDVEFKTEDRICMENIVLYSVLSPLDSEFKGDSVASFPLRNLSTAVSLEVMKDSLSSVHGIVNSAVRLPPVSTDILGVK